MRCPDIMVVMPERENLVVALTIGRGKHSSYQRHIELVAQAHRHLAQAEDESSLNRGCKMYIEVGLGGIITIACAVKAPDKARQLRTNGQAEA